MSLIVSIAEILLTLVLVVLRMEVVSGLGSRLVVSSAISSVLVTMAAMVVTVTATVVVMVVMVVTVVMVDLEEVTVLPMAVAAPALLLGLPEPRQDLEDLVVVESFDT